MADDSPAPPKKTYVLDATPVRAPPTTPAVVGGRPSAAPPPRGPSPWRRRMGLVVLALACGAVGAAIAAVLLLPGYVRRKCIEAAAEQGIVLAVDDVHVGAGKFLLVNVTASSPELPKMSAKAAEVEIEMSGLDVARVVAKAGEIAIDGSYENVKRALDAWQRAHATEARGKSATPPRFVIEAMHVAWTRAFGDEGRIDTLETHAEIARRGAELRFSTPHATLTASAGTFGPWRVTYDRDASAVRARLAFDPQLADGPSALLIGDADGTRVTTLDVDIARTPLASLGIPAVALGLRGSEQIEATVRYRRTSPVRIEARADVALFALRIASVPMPLDAKLTLAAVGDPSNALDVKKGELAIGPLHGAVLGTLRVFDDGARIDLAWSAAPIACASLVTLPAEPPGMPPPLPDITAEVQQFLQATGLAKVTGEVHMAAALTFDSRDVGQTRATLSPRATCNVVLFGGGGGGGGGGAP